MVEKSENKEESKTVDSSNFLKYAQEALKDYKETLERLKEKGD